MTILNINGDKSRRIVAIFAHPDDAELLCLGTLLRYRSDGADVTLVIASTGEKGVSVADRDSGVTLSAQQRLSETLASVSRFGIEVITLGFVDGSLTFGQEVVSSIERVLSRLRPEIIITHFVDDSGFDHQDHVAVGRSCKNATNRCSFVNLLLFCEPLYSVRSSFRPNLFVDVTDHFDSKMAALSCHESQAGRGYLTREFHLQRARRYSLTVGENQIDSSALWESFQIGFCVIN